MSTFNLNLSLILTLGMVIGCTENHFNSKPKSPASISNVKFEDEDAQGSVVKGKRSPSDGLNETIGAGNGSGAGGMIDVSAGDQDLGSMQESGSEEMASEAVVEEIVEDPTDYPKGHSLFEFTPEEAAAQLAIICARPGTDKVRQVFCSPTPPVIGKLTDLQQALGLSFPSPAPGRNSNGANGNAAFTLIGHSSSLVGKFTNPLNPRAVIFTPEGNNALVPDMVAMGFLRGEQFAEIIARDPDTGEMKFFLVIFKQACNDTPEGCAIGQLLSPSVENNWTGINIKEDLDLLNTPADCTHCHQPEGEGTEKILRMQELRNPWTHFFRANRDGGQAMIAMYESAHGTDEVYAGIPASMVTSSSDPANLEDVIRQQGFGNQPNEFLTGDVRDEVNASSPNQPQNNIVPGVSQVWLDLYQEAASGRAIPVPYHDTLVTDPAIATQMAAAYSSYRAGVLAETDLPDLRKSFLQSELPKIGFAVADDAGPQQILVEACAQCHNPKLESQATTRKNFTFTPPLVNTDDIRLSFSATEKTNVMTRICLPHDHLKVMPPEAFRELSKGQIQSVIDFLNDSGVPMTCEDFTNLKEKE